MSRSAIIRKRSERADGGDVVTIPSGHNGAPAGGVTDRRISGGPLPVLLVEDMAGYDLALARYIKDALPQATVDVCDMEVGARLRLAKTDYKVLVIDYQLPDGFGPNLLHELVRENRQIGVVLQSGLEQVAGVACPPAIVPKPVTPDGIRAFVQAVQRAAARPLRPDYSPATVLRLARSFKTMRSKRTGLSVALQHHELREVAEMSGLGYEAVRKAAMAGLYDSGLTARRSE